MRTGSKRISLFSFSMFRLGQEISLDSANLHGVSYHFASENQNYPCSFAAGRRLPTSIHKKSVRSPGSIYSSDIEGCFIAGKGRFYSLVSFLGTGGRPRYTMGRRMGYFHHLSSYAFFFFFDLSSPSLHDSLLFAPLVYS